jgi:hypothetical protein
MITHHTVHVIVSAVSTAFMHLQAAQYYSTVQPPVLLLPQPQVIFFQGWINGICADFACPCHQLINKCHTDCQQRNSPIVFLLLGQVQVLLLAQPKLLADGVCVMPYLSTPSAAAFLTPECLGQLFAKGAHLTCPSTSVGATQQIETLRNNVLQVWINQMAGLLVTAQRNAGWDEKAAGSKGDASRVPEVCPQSRGCLLSPSAFGNRLSAD